MIRGPYRRASLVFQTPYGAFELYKRDPLYQLLAEAGYDDASKKGVARVLYNSGLLSSTPDRVVSFKTNIGPQFALNLCPLAQQIILIHDTYLKAKVAKRLSDNRRRKAHSRARHQKPPTQPEECLVLTGAEHVLLNGSTSPIFDDALSEPLLPDDVLPDNRQYNACSHTLHKKPPTQPEAVFVSTGAEPLPHNESTFPIFDNALSEPLLPNDALPEPLLLHNSISPSLDESIPEPLIPDDSATSPILDDALPAPLLPPDNSGKFIDRFSLFVTPSRPPCKREARLLCEETRNLLERNYRWKQSSFSGSFVKKIKPVTYHDIYQNGSYGEGTAMNSNTKSRSKRKKIFKDPKYLPQSAGLPLVPPKGKWFCPRCLQEQDLRNALCIRCHSTPIRTAKITLPILGHTFDPITLDENCTETASQVDDDFEKDPVFEPIFARGQHKRILRDKQVSEYGKVWTAADTKGTNHRQHLEWMALDVPPTRDKMWNTTFLVPKNLNTIFARISSSFRLDHQSKLKSLFEYSIKIQKAECQVVGAFNLDIIAHGVFGDRAHDALMKHAGIKETRVLNKGCNHYYDEGNPLCPIVMNLRNVEGLSDRRIIKLISFPNHLIGIDLLTQINLVVLEGLSKFANEFVSLSYSDSLRKILGFNMGFSPREGPQWKRKNGSGIAEPGLYKNSGKASPQFRRWILHLATLICHQFLQRFLGETTRSKQSMLSKTRRHLLEDWIDYFGLRDDVACPITRLCEGITLHTGSTLVHFDSQNDPEAPMDHITWALNYIGDWRDYASDESIKILEKTGVPTRNTAFTVLCYMRRVMSSQAKKLDGIIDTTCPLFVEMAGVNMSEQPVDVATLGGYQDIRTIAFIEYALHHGTLRHDYDYRGYYATLREGLNRFLFLGSIAYSWLRFVDCYFGKVIYQHAVEFVAFSMREINGAPLIVGLMDLLISNHKSSEVSAILSGGGIGSFYIYLSGELSRIHGGRMDISSKDPRWQKVGGLLYQGRDGDRDRVILYINFVDDCLSRLQKGNTNEVSLARGLLTSRKKRALHLQSEDTKRVIELGPVRGTFGIHLSAFMNMSPADNIAFATIERGSSGYYLCVNALMHQEFGVDFITTEEAGVIVDGVIVDLNKKGMKVSQSWMDQNCCRWWRMNGIPGKDEQKPDILFFENSRKNRLFCPFRYRLAKGGHLVEFFVAGVWYNLNDYIIPASERASNDTPIRRQPQWKGGSLSDFRNAMCGSNLI